MIVVRRVYGDGAGVSRIFGGFNRHGTSHFAAGILLTYEPVLLMLPPVKNPYDVKHAMANAGLKRIDHEARQSG